MCRDIFLSYINCLSLAEDRKVAGSRDPGACSYAAGRSCPVGGNSENDDLETHIQGFHNKLK